MCEECITKRCSKCSEEFPATLEHFHRSSATKDGLHAWCHGCMREYNRRRYPPKPKEEKLLPETWVCRKCSIEHPATSEYFGRGSRSLSGLSYYCRDCTRERSRKTRLTYLQNEKIVPETCACARCHQEFFATTEYFGVASGTKSGLRCYCRTCDRELQREGNLITRGAPKRKHRTYCDDVPSGMKRCLVCGKDFPATLDCFYHVSKNKDGLSSYCQTCSRERAREARMKNPEADRDNARNWAANNPDRRKEIANNYARRNKDKTRKYSQEHREENNARTLRYSKEHPEVKRAVKIKRRAKLTAAGGDYSPGELRQQFASQDGLCYWCSTPLDAKYHSDHYIPISKGGSGYAANIVCSCPRCNRWKHDKMPDVFMEELRAEGIAGLWCAHTAQNHMEE